MKTASLMASLSRNSGGLFESVRRLHQCLAEIPDVSVSVLGLRDEYTEADRAAWLPIEVKDFAMRWPQQLGYAPGMKQALLKLDTEIIHTHGIWRYPSIVTSDWHRQTGRPYLVSPHGMLDPWAVKNSAWKKKPAWFFYERGHLQNAACLRALCASEAGAMRALGLKNPICIIPNGIDLPPPGRRTTDDGGQLARLRPLASGLWPLASGRKTLLYLGRLHPKKGLVNLLRAWAENRRSEIGNRKSAEWVLALAGWDQGGHEAELKVLCSELSVESSVQFLGPKFGEDKAACYRDCDAFILPSVSEGLPIVILEAWAYGKPVLMTPECNLPEGFAAHAALRIETSVESIAQGLQELFRTPPSALRILGNNGQALAAARFTWPKIAGEMKSVYDWLLGGGSKPDCVIES